jgi:hypothetical protein
MIDLGTLGGLFEHRHELHAYCLRCDRWHVLPLASMVAQGKGSLRLPLRMRCRDCGQRGQLQVRPPMPSHPRASGWIGTAEMSCPPPSEGMPAFGAQQDTL